MHEVDAVAMDRAAGDGAYPPGGGKWRGARIPAVAVDPRFGVLVDTEPHPEPPMNPPPSVCPECYGCGLRVFPEMPMRQAERFGLQRLQVVHTDGVLERNLGGPRLDGDRIVVRDQACDACDGTGRVRP